MNLKHYVATYTGFLKLEEIIAALKVPIYLNYIINNPTILYDCHTSDQ